MDNDCPCGEDHRDAEFYKVTKSDIVVVIFLLLVFCVAVVYAVWKLAVMVLR